MAVPDNGTVLITCRSGETEFQSRMSEGVFRRYAEAALRDLNAHQQGPRVVPFERAG